MKKFTSLLTSIVLAVSLLFVSMGAQAAAVASSDSRATEINRGLRSYTSTEEIIARVSAPVLAAKRQQLHKATAFVEFLKAFDPASVGFGLLCFPAGPWGSVVGTTVANLVLTPDFNSARR